MRRFIFSVLSVCLVAYFVVSCETKKKEIQEVVVEEKPAVKDSAYYGMCGEGTSMHSLELITDDGKKMTFVTDEDSGSVVIGGLYNGDRLTVVCHKTEEGLLAERVVNLTTLLGRWTSLDRNFEIKEDGSVESNVTAETRPYTAWSMANAKLVLNADTFSVESLGPDSMAIENNLGIFVYKRQK